MNKLIIVISNQIDSDFFWKLFINIQNAIHDVDKLTIVAYKGDAKINQLSHGVYKSHLILLENHIDVCSGYRNTNMETVLQNIQSVSNAIRCLDSFNIEDESKVLLLRGGGNYQIILDKSLSSEYLYLEYSNYVDLGYEDSWIYGPYGIIKKFKVYDQYVCDLLNECKVSKIYNKNYLRCFSFVKYKLQIIKDKFNKFFLKSALKIIQNNIFKVLFSFVSHRMSNLEIKIYKIMESSFISKDNSSLISMMPVINPFKLCSYDSRNILKAFLLSNKIRKNVRFLESHDFTKTHHGQMINPIDFVCIIYSHSSNSNNWKTILEDALDYLPENCMKIYLLSEDSVKTDMIYTGFYRNIKVELLKYDSKLNYMSQLKGVLDMKNAFRYAYFMHDTMLLKDRVDAVYLNSLLHYMRRSKELYIKLFCSNYTKIILNNSQFPNLHKSIEKGCDILTQPCIFDINNINTLEKSGNETNILPFIIPDISEEQNMPYSHYFPHKLSLSKINKGLIDENN
jgi:hypothetical protein